MISNKYTSGAISLASLDRVFSRADVEFHGLDHSGASYEGAVFLNNASAGENTGRTLAEGYAGSFHIFGHGGCFGDEGHCEITGAPRLYDPRPAHQLTPARKVVIATEAVKNALSQGESVTVTVVPIIRSGTEKCDFSNVLQFDHLSIVTYR